MMSHAKVHLAVNYCILIGLVIYYDYYARAIVGCDGRCTCSLSFAFAQLALEKYLRDSNTCEGRLVCNSVSGVDTVQIIKGYDWRVLSSAPQTLSPRVITTYITLLKCFYINAQALLLKTAVN